MEFPEGWLATLLAPVQKLGGTKRAVEKDPFQVAQIDLLQEGRMKGFAFGGARFGHFDT
jgi:hypothetical protein